jgi:hypothetical protein
VAWVADDAQKSWATPGVRGGRRNDLTRPARLVWAMSGVLFGKWPPAIAGGSLVAGLGDPAERSLTC